MSRRCVITGIGVVAPTGIGAGEHWKNSLTGECRIGPLPDAGSDTGSGAGSGGRRLRVAGEVTGFDATQFVQNRLVVQTDRWTWMAFAAAQLALQDAGLDLGQHDPFELSVVTSSASGGNAFGQREIQALWSRGPQAVSAYQSIGWFYAASTGQLSIRHQMKGPCGVVVSDGAGGIDAVAQACRFIRHGAAPGTGRGGRRGTNIVLVGGTEAPLSPYAIACQSSLPYLSTRDDPAAYRPFDADANGYVPGEGGALLVVEDLSSAEDRGATCVYAEVAGSASTHDGYHHTEPAPDPRQLVRAIREALARAGCPPDGVDVVFADGAGDRVRDALEVAALREVFGARAGRVPVTVPKSLTGRLCSGGAALDLAWAAMALHHGVIPPTANLDPSSAGYGLDFVVEARRPERLRTALVVARGIGGFNAAAVLRSPPAVRTVESTVESTAESTVESTAESTAEPTPEPESDTKEHT